MIVENDLPNKTYINRHDKKKIVLDLICYELNPRVTLKIWLTVKSNSCKNSDILCEDKTDVEK